jgi:hypothetical protein
MMVEIAYISSEPIPFNSATQELTVSKATLPPDIQEFYAKLYLRLQLVPANLQSNQAAKRNETVKHQTEAKVITNQ